MSKPWITIKNKPALNVNFSETWVHFQELKTKSFELYEVFVPEQLCAKVFLSDEELDDVSSLPGHIQNDIDSLGTFIVDSYFKSILESIGENLKPYKWVVVSVEKVEKAGDGVMLMGKIIPFQE